MTTAAGLLDITEPATEVQKKGALDILNQYMTLYKLPEPTLSQKTDAEKAVYTQCQRRAFIKWFFEHLPADQSQDRSSAKYRCNLCGQEMQARIATAVNHIFALSKCDLIQFRWVFYFHTIVLKNNAEEVLAVQKSIIPVEKYPVAPLDFPILLADVAAAGGPVSRVFPVLEHWRTLLPTKLPLPNDVFYEKIATAAVLASKSISPHGLPDHNNLLPLYVSGMRRIFGEAIARDIPLDFLTSEPVMEGLKELGVSEIALKSFPTSYERKKLFLKGEVGGEHEVLLARIKQRAQTRRPGALNASVVVDSWKPYGGGSLLGFVFDVEGAFSTVGLIPLEVRETGVSLARKLDTLIVHLERRFQVTINSICSDSAKNCILMKQLTCGRRPNIVSMPCFAHQLQLISLRFTALCKKERTALRRARLIVARINANDFMRQFLTYCTNLFYHDGKSKRLPSSRLKKMSNTRWNSAHSSICSILQVRSALVYMVRAMKDANTLVADRWLPPDADTSVDNKATLKKLWQTHRGVLKYIDSEEYSFFERLMNLEKILRPIAKALVKFQRQDLTLADVFEGYLAILHEIKGRYQAEKQLSPKLKATATEKIEELDEELEKLNREIDEEKNKTTEMAENSVLSREKEGDGDNERSENKGNEENKNKRINYSNNQKSKKKDTSKKGGNSKKKQKRDPKKEQRDEIIKKKEKLKKYIVGLDEQLKAWGELELHMEYRWYLSEVPLMLLAYMLHPVHAGTFFKVLDSESFILKTKQMTTLTWLYMRTFVLFSAAVSKGDVLQEVVNWREQAVNIERVNDCEDPIAFWSVEAQDFKFNHLPKLALFLFSIKVQSADCERLFSACAAVKTRNRTLIGNDMLELYVSKKWHIWQQKAARSLNKARPPAVPDSKEHTKAMTADSDALQESLVKLGRNSPDSLSSHSSGVSKDINSVLQTVRKTEEEQLNKKKYEVEPECYEDFLCRTNLKQLKTSLDDSPTRNKTQPSVAEDVENVLNDIPDYILDGAYPITLPSAEVDECVDTERVASVRYRLIKEDKTLARTMLENLEKKAPGKFWDIKTTDIDSLLKKEEERLIQNRNQDFKGDDYRTKFPVVSEKDIRIPKVAKPDRINRKKTIRSSITPQSFRDLHIDLEDFYTEWVSVTYRAQQEQADQRFVTPQSSRILPSRSVQFMLDQNTPEFPMRETEGLLDDNSNSNLSVDRFPPFATTFTPIEGDTSRQALHEDFEET